MDWIRGTTLVVMALASLAQGAAAQDRPDPEAAYLRAVAEFFRVPASEMEIMRDWRLPADEIPVVLFLANRAGVSP